MTDPKVPIKREEESVCFRMFQAVRSSQISLVYCRMHSSKTSE